MSMMRASGAIPVITALQIATASLAAPKSLMKTMVGLRDRLAAVSRGAGAFAQPEKIPANTNIIERRNFCVQNGIRFLSFRSGISICASANKFRIAEQWEFVGA